MFLSKAKSKVGAFMIATVLLVPLGAEAGMVFWDGGGDGSSWNDPANWDPDGVPTGMDDVTIDVAGDITVVHSAGDHSVNNLNSAEAIELTGGSLSISGTALINNDFAQSGGTLGGDGDLTVSGSLAWTGGFMEGNGITTADGGLEITGSFQELRGDRTLNNTATANLTSASGFPLRVGGTAVIHNSGTFNVLDAADILANGAVDPLFDNDGVFNKSGVDTLTTVSIPFNNNDTVQVPGGTLELSGGGTQVGSFSGGGTVEFGGGNHLLDTLSSVTVSNVIFSGGTSEIHGTYDLIGSSTTVSSGTHTFHPDATVGGAGQALTISGGMVDFSSGEQISVTTYEHSNGTLTGVSVPFNNNDTVQVSEGTLDLGGAFVNYSGMTLTGGTYVVTANLQNDGTIFISKDCVYDLGGNYMQGGTGTFAIVFAGLTAGVSHGVMNIGGTATLAGTLTAEQADEFVPENCDEMNVLTSNLLVDQFELEDLPPITSFPIWAVEYENNTVTLVFADVDLNEDDLVGPFDIAAVLGAWGPNPGDPADLNCDGIVGPGDLALVLGSWGAAPPL